MYSRCLKRVLDFCCALAAIACFGIPASAWGANSPVISANPNAAFSNGNAYLQQGIPLLLEYHNLTVGDQRQRFAYPQRNYDFRNAKSRFESSNGILQYGLNANAAAGVSAAYKEYDSATDKVLPGGFVGVSVSGYLDSLDFDLNAALYVEHHNHENPPSADRQGTGWVLWDSEGDKTINYKRFQGHLGFNYAWLRLELGRDALHWGPGVYNNLTLNRQAVPYGYASADLVFGPLRVISFYGSLDIDSVGSNVHSDASRNLYGHRYELAFGNATFGMNEIQVVYNNNNAWLFVPVFPLFIEKGNYTEQSNNGALSFDANYRIMQNARVYGEFYTDDFDSPIAVVENEYLNSQWALMLGMQVAHNFVIQKRQLELGSVFEYARVDQRVYTHYNPNEGQIANAGYPLGNQHGPNSQTVDLMFYSQFDKTLFVGLRNTWLWKGNVYGSTLNNKWIGTGKYIKKDFLGGAKMKYSLTPMLAYNSNRWQCSGAVTLFAEKKGELNFSVSL